MISRGIFLFTEVEGRISAAMGATYHPLPARPFGRKVITGGALLAFASSKIGHCIYVHAIRVPWPWHIQPLTMAHSNLDMVD